MRIAAAKKLHNISKKFFDNFLHAYIGHAGKTLPWVQNICKRVHGNTSLGGFTPASPEPSKMCRAKQLQARMHIDANIHSWEYNKPACQTLIFLSVQISTQL